MPVIDQRAEIGIQKILLATDFSPVSGVATAYANAIARRFSAEVEAANVVALAVAFGWGGALAPDATDHLRHESEEGLEQVLHDFVGVKAEAKTLEAFSPAEAILEEAKNTSPDIIVMGTTAKHGMEKIMLGSTAEAVIRRAPCPVLTVGPHVPMPANDPLAFRNILYVTDFSPQAQHAAIFALSFAEDSGAHLFLCHVSPEPQTELCDELVTDQAIDEALRKIVPVSAYDWCTPHFVVQHGYTPAAILQLAEEIAADLIVVGSRKATFWVEHMQTGLTPAILASTKCPVLTVC